jgi:DNA-binding GntR family transcriptional regulator
VVGEIARSQHDMERHPRSLAETAWRHIREQILYGELASGSPIRVKELAEYLGMSMMPVREAVKRLQQEGLIVQEAHKEPMVAPLSVADMEDVYRVRIALEGLAVELACAHIDEVSYQRLNDLLDRFENAYNAGDVKDGREFHRLFHIELAATGGSAALNRLIPSLIDTSERYRELSVPQRGSAAERRKEHQIILDACMSRRVEETRALLTEHLLKTVSLVRKALD